MLKLIILIVIGVLALSFFGISLQSIVNSPAGQANFGYLWYILVSLWDWFINLIHSLPQTVPLPSFQPTTS